MCPLFFPLRNPLFLFVRKSFWLLMWHPALLKSDLSIIDPPVSPFPNKIMLPPAVDPPSNPGLFSNGGPPPPPFPRRLPRQFFFFFFFLGTSGTGVVLLASFWCPPSCRSLDWFFRTRVPNSLFLLLKTRFFFHQRVPPFPPPLFYFLLTPVVFSFLSRCGRLARPLCLCRSSVFPFSFRLLRTKMFPFFCFNGPPTARFLPLRSAMKARTVSRPTHTCFKTPSKISFPH